MADIDIQERKRPIWPWILGIVAVVALVWVLYEAFDDEERYDETADETIITEPREDEGVAYGDPVDPRNDAGTMGMAFAAPVQEYVTYVENNENRMGENHTYTAQGLRELSEALSALVDNYGTNNQTLMQDRDKLNQAANEIQQDPNSTMHADKVRNAFIAAANIMDRIQENNFSDLNNEVEQVSDAADNLKADKDLLSQKSEVNKFFKESKEVLEEMASVDQTDNMHDNMKDGTDNNNGTKDDKNNNY